VKFAGFKLHPGSESSPTVVLVPASSRPAALHDSKRTPEADVQLGSIHRPENNNMRGQGGTPVSLLLSWLTTRSTAFAAIVS